MSEIRVFVSYCRRDDLWVKEGEFGLIPWLAKSLARRGVEIWYDRALMELPGEDFREKIEDEIDQAQFAILLISQEFLNSEFIREYEMPRIKARVDRGHMITIPILVDHTLWEYEDELKWITDRQMLPGTPTPLIDYTADLPQWRRVRAEILRAILHRVHERSRPALEPAGEPTARDSAPKPPVRAAPRAEPRPSPQLDEREPAGVAAGSESDTTGEVIQEGPADREPVAPVWTPGELQVLGHHGSAVDVVAVSPDGNRAVTGSSDRTLKVWDLKTGTELLTLTGHSDDLKALAVTRDGKQVYSASADGVVIVWDLETGKQLRSLELDTLKHAPLAAVTLAPEGQRAVATLSKRPTHLTWDLERARLLYSTGHRSPKPAVQRNFRLTGAVMTPDGRRIAVAKGDSSIHFKVEQVGRTLSLTGLTGSVNALALTPAGRRVVAGSEDGTITVWDLMSDGELLTATEKGIEAMVKKSCSLSGHTGAVTTVAVTPDGRRAVSGSRDRAIQVWDLSSGDMIAKHEGDRAVCCVALAQGESGMRVVAGDSGGRVLLLSLENQQLDYPLRQAAAPDYATTVALKDQGLGAPAAAVSSRHDDLGPNGARPGPGELHVLGRHGGSINSVALTPDGRRAVSGSADHTLKLWDLESGAELRTLAGHNDEALTVAVTLDGQRAFSAAADGEILLWDLNRGERLETVKPSTDLKFLSACIAPDGRRAVRLYLSHRLNRTRAYMDAFDLYEGPVHWSGAWTGGLNPPPPTVVAWALSADGQRMVRAREDGAIQYRGLEPRAESIMLEGHTDTVSALAITSDARQAVSGSYDCTVRVWDLRKASEVTTLEGHSDVITAVAVAEGARSAVSVGRDKTLIVWDLDTYQATTTVRTDYPVRCCAISQEPDGLTIVAGDSGGQVGLLRLGSEVRAAGAKPEAFAAKTKVAHARTSPPSTPLPKSATTPPVSPTSSVDPTIPTAPIFAQEEPPVELVRLGRGSISKIAPSPDGAMLAVASSLGIWIYGVESFEPLRLLGSGHRAESLTWSPDGRRVASGDYAGVIRVWDADSGSELMALEGHQKAVAGLAWSPDGTRLLSGGHDQTFRVWDADSGSGILMHETGVACTDVAWSPEGQRAAIVASSRVCLWDIHEREQYLSLEHRNSVTGVTWSPDGTQLATATVQCVCTWDVASGEERLALKGHRRWVKSVAWSSDGGLLASAGADGTVRVWNATGGECVHVLEGHRLWIKSVTWLPDSARVLSLGSDETVRLWDAIAGQELLVLEGHTGDLMDVAWSPGGAHLASGDSHGAVLVWNTDAWKLVHKLEVSDRRITSLAWSPDEARLASASSTAVLLLDTRSGWKLREFRGHTDEILQIEWSPDGARLASGSKDGSIRVWDTSPGGGQLCTIRGRKCWVRFIAWSQDSTQLSTKCSRYGDRTVQVWDAISGQELESRRLEKIYASYLAWSPDRTKLAVALDRKLWIADAADGEMTVGLKGHADRVTSVAWSLDGTNLASGGSDGTVRVWDASTAEQVCILKGHLAAVSGLAWAPDGKRLASAGSDGTVRVWGVRAEQKVKL